MSLRTKILYILTVVVALYAAIDNGTLRLVASGFFENWETEDGDADMRLVLAAVENQVDALDDSVRIWAGMDQTLSFVQEQDEAARERFIQRELGVRAMQSAGVDVFYITDAGGKVLWSHVRDPETGEKIRLTRPLPSSSLDPNSRLTLVPVGEETISGLASSDRGPMLISSMPVRDAEGIGFLPDTKSRFRRSKYGHVIMAKFLDAELRANIGASANCDVRFINPKEEKQEGERESLVAGLTSNEYRTASLVEEDEKLHVFASLFDEASGENLLIEAVLERRIARLGERAVDYALVSTIGSALLILFVLLRLLAKFVLSPLSKLTNKAVEIGRTDDTTIRVDMQRDDEIGQLASEFDSMLEKLADSRRQVVQTARKAGMSEIATGVLHNVGNVLNSVNVSASLVAKGTEDFSLKDLDAVIQVLSDQEDNLAEFITEDPRGKHLIPFLSEVAEGLSKQKASIVDEIQSLTGGIDHIADLVRSQQTFAGTKGVFEFASLEEEMEQAMHICDQSLDKHDKLEVVREFDELPTIKVDKHKLKEILVNLIQNAQQSILESDSPLKRLTLRILQTDDGKARIEVEDSGLGISEENLNKVFNHGFTTKADGHGFGLHVSANAATEMSASLQVRSEGLGHGAAFFLDLPMESPEVMRTA